MEPTAADAAVTTVEIRIRTLDSSNYTVRVDKDMPVPALKDQLAPVVGVPPQNQRLICRGKVLKDDQLLSSYNVEDGHTLHLVPRPPASSSGDEGVATQPPTDSGGTSSRPRPAQITHSLLLGTINIPEATEGGLPDLNRIISAVLNSVGSGNAAQIDNRRGVAMMQVHSASGVSASSAPASATSSVPPAPAESNSSRHHAAVTAGPNSADSFQFRNLEVAPDALTTLSQYLTRMEQAFSENGYGALSSLFGNSLLSPLLSNASRSSHSASASTTPSLPSRPLPTPAALGATIGRVQELLHGPTSAALTHLAGQLENEATIVDTTARAELQSIAVWSGNVMQQLGALLMELGRTTLTLRLGPSPAQAVVNSGPAVFVSSSGPNPMMVQPLPFQTGLPLGAFPLGAAAQSEPVSGGGTVRNVSMNFNANDIGRRPFSHIPLFSSSLQQSPLLSDSLATLEPSVVDGNGGEPPEGSGVRPLAGDHDSPEHGLGILVQENGAVRIIPMRSRSAASVSGINLHSSIHTGAPSLFRGLRASQSDPAVAVPVLGIRAQVHAHPWTQAVLQASEGQRPVDIAVTIPVDVTTSQAGDIAQQQSPADTGVVDSVPDGLDANANGSQLASSNPDEADRSALASNNNCSEQTDDDGAQDSGAEGCPDASKMDIDTCKVEGSGMEQEHERFQRKRAGERLEVTGGTESCMSSDLQVEEVCTEQGSDAKRQKVIT